MSNVDKEMWTVCFTVCIVVVMMMVFQKMCQLFWLGVKDIHDLYLLDDDDRAQQCLQQALIAERERLVDF